MDLQQSSAHAAKTATTLAAEGSHATQHTHRFPGDAQPRWRAGTATMFALVLVVLLGCYFRALSLTDWDAGTGQHPDERFFTNVASSVRLPGGPGEYFDSARSPLNPRNYSDFPLYVYGPLPITLTRMVAVVLTPEDALPERVPAIAYPPAGKTNYGPEVANPERSFPRLALLHQFLNPDGRNLTGYFEIYKVGRTLAMIFDLGSILLTFLIARTLFGRSVGLLAALLSALTVMQIQQAHFFVDPIFSTFFCLLTLYWAIRVAQTGSWHSYAFMGISIGLAMANRITLATLGLVAIVAALLETLAAIRRMKRPFTGRFLSRGLPLLCLAGTLTLLTYRTFQPDAFTGSLPDSPPIPSERPMPRLLEGLGFFDIRPDPRFLENLSTVRSLVTGEYDFPPSQQWVNRPAYLFPWQNMVIWGMGPLLGLAAWGGWLAFGVRQLVPAVAWLRGHKLPADRLAAAFTHPAWVIWIWVAFYFTWQGAQFAITMRYMLPIYGALISFAAWGLIGVWHWARTVKEQPPNTNSHSPTISHRLSAIIYRLLSIGYRLLVWLPLIVIAATFAWAYAFSHIYRQPHSRVMAANWLAERASPGSYIASEVWDDALPLNVDGENLWGTVYRGIDTAPYGEDDPQKYFGSFNAQGQYQEGLLDQLEQADYITLTSNRVYDSVTRLPYRYPAQTRYYHYLFNGELGFELVAEVTSYPRFLGFEIPDQRAEEAFTVYDHPRVLIFRKTPEFSRERAEKLLTSGINWGEVYKLPVRVADRTTTALRITESEWPTYRAGGTWAGLFNSSTLANALAPLTWLLALELLGLAGFALLFRLLPQLPDRGFSLARMLALLLVAYVAWLFGSLRIAPFTPLTLWLCTLPLLVAGAWAGWQAREELAAFWQNRRKMLLIAQSFYLGFFLLGLALRWFNSDLWHPARGGEKLMELAYLNAVLKSTAFPPYDPWHAGGYINYYYFGFVIVGALIHLTGVTPAVAYNLAVPTLFALAALGCWGVVYNLLARGMRSDQEAGAEDEVSEHRDRRALLSALLAPLFVLLLGNLAQALWYITGYAAEQLKQGRAEWAFWDATRIVPGTVNEFPFFTFLFADLHAHMIAIPLALATLGLGVALVRIGERGLGSGDWGAGSGAGIRLWFVILLLGLLAGALRVTNTWDYPTYVGLTVVTLALLAWRWFDAAPKAERLRSGVRAGLFFVAAAATLVVVGNLLFLPFTRHFATESSGVELLRAGVAGSMLLQLLAAERTTIGDLLRLYGLWLFLLVSAGLLLARRLSWRFPDAGLLVGMLAGLLAVLALAGAVLGWAAPLLTAPLLGGGLWLVWRMRRRPAAALLPAIWGVAAIGLCLLVDLVVVKGDVGRMNTVFKFGIHTWTLFGLSAAVVLPWLWTVVGRRWTVQWLPATARSPYLQLFAWFWRGAAVVLLLMAAVYPLTATPARLADRFAPGLLRTLDGMAFMRYVEGDENGQRFPLAEDAEAITWLQRNVEGTPVILEAHLPSYRWAGRVATFTGLPTILGWEWHQIQQRMAVQAEPVINHRQNVISQIYNSPDQKRALGLLRDYGVEYLYVGGVERAIYEQVGLAKFEQMVVAGQLETVFRSGATTIYRVVEPGQPTMLTTDLAVEPPSQSWIPPLMLDRPVNELPAVEGYAWNKQANGSSWLATLLWLAVFYLFALLGLPAALLAFGGTEGRRSAVDDGGVTWARLIGLLLTGYVIWLPVSLGLWRYDAWGVTGGVLLVVVLNLALLALIGRREGDGDVFALLARGFSSIGARLRTHWWAILVGDLLFVGGFALFVALRVLNPDLWHPIWGGEKPMGFGFLNAIVRSPVMPPYDPFFSGGYINYYYYGLYLISLPIRLFGIDPAIAFNLAVATLAGLIFAGSYTIVARMTGHRRYGLVAVAFVALLGNLTTVIAAGWSRGIGAAVATLSSGDLAGFGERLGDWYVGPSRVIPFTINEFPFWSLLFADLHPHLIALPITLLAIGLAYRLVEAPAVARLNTITRLSLAALLLGTLAVTNSWDFPTYGLLIAAALFGSAWRQGHGFGRALLVASGGLGLMLSGMVLYAPFFDRFYAMVSGLGVVHDFTGIRDYLLVYGAFVAALLPLVVGAALRVWGGQRHPVRAIGASAIVVLALLALVAPDIGLRLWLGALLLLTAALLLQRKISVGSWFTLLLVATAWGVSLGIESVFIRDHLAGGDWYRMNTVFKFGMQIWVLLALAAAAALPLLARALQRIGGESARTVGMTVILLPALVGAIFPFVGTPSRVANRFEVSSGPTLDGLAFMNEAVFDYDCASNGGCTPGKDQVTIDLRGDAEAIAWIKNNLSGTPIMLQSSLWFYRAYGIRVAANTGLPTVVSALHVNEQRDPYLASVRDSDVDEIYRTLDSERALRLLAKYRVNYVYIGGVEHALYGPAGLGKFEALRDNYLNIIYDAAGVQIYQVRGIPAVYAVPEPALFPERTLPPQPVAGESQPQDLAGLEAAVEANPTDGPLVFGLAERYRSLGRLDDAARVLAVAAAANPSDIGLHHLWGDILAQAVRYDEAEQAYLLATRAAPTAGNWTKLGAGLLAWGKLDKAELALNQALAINNVEPEPYYRLGQLYAERDEKERAIGALQTYLSIAPQGQFYLEAQILLDGLVP